MTKDFFKGVVAMAAVVAICGAGWAGLREVRLARDASAAAQIDARQARAASEQVVVILGRMIGGAAR